MKTIDHPIDATEHPVQNIPIASINTGMKRNILIAFNTALLSYVGACSLFYGWSIRTIILLSFSIVLILIFKRIYRTWSSAVIKGDSLILKNTENKALVTHVRSIRSISSRRLGKKQITSIKYKLDGAQHKALLISDATENDPPQIMIRRIQREIKNKKANL